MSAENIPLSLYLHFPWCVRKCPYCDFNSYSVGHTADDAAPRDRYIAALIEDLTRKAMLAESRAVQSVFMGGGTPSFFDARQIGSVLDAVGRAYTLAANCEITLEANPGTVERGRLIDYRQAGVNRLSLGAQSFDAESLRRLGRSHGPDEIVKAYAEGERAGYPSINLDLMFALPGQTAGLALADLALAVELDPQHISWYQLTLEPNTVFHAQPPVDLPDDDQAAEIHDRGRALLIGAGYGHYEISAFAKPGFECRHNLNYWAFGDYLAAGAGAHAKYTDRDGRIWRYRKPLNPASYIDAIEREDDCMPRGPVGAADAAFEFMLNGLRLPAGFSEARFVERTGQSFDSISGVVREAALAGLLERGAGDAWRPTLLGLRHLNDLQARFLPTGPAD